jgi:hypothetical protein
LDLLVATDFFTAEVWTLLGLKTYYVLFLIRSKTREIHVSGLMKDEIKKRVEDIFGKHDERKLAQKKDQERTKTEKETLLEDFAKAITQVIRPSMKEFGVIMKARNHGFAISATKEVQNINDRTADARV